MMLIKCDKCQSHVVDEIISQNKVAFKCHNCGHVSSRAFALDSELKLGITDDNDLYHMAVCLVIENQKNQLLMGNRRFYPYQWSLFFGHVRNGETVKQAAIRELTEETSIRSEKMTSVHREIVQQSCRKGINLHDISIYKIVAKSDSYFAPDNESSEIKWVDKNKITELQRHLNKISELMLKKLKII